MVKVARMPTATKPRVHASVYIPDRQYQRVKARLVGERKTFSALVRDLLSEYLERAK